MGLLAPPLMIIIMRITNNRQIMGERTNGPAINLLGWITTAAVSVATLCLIWAWLGGGLRARFRWVPANVRLPCPPGRPPKKRSGTVLFGGPLPPEKRGASS